MKGASFNDAILSFFSRHGQYFHPTKDQPRTRPPSPFLYICCNFGQIFCTNVIQFFSVENMGHNQLRKCSKYHLVSLLNKKQRSTFGNFVHLFYPFPPQPIMHWQGPSSSWKRAHQARKHWEHPARLRSLPKVSIFSKEGPIQLCAGWSNRA